MTALYLLFAAAGVPLVAWSLFAGDGDGGDGGGDAGDAGTSAGAIMLRLLPLSTLAIAAASFGVTGLALTLVDTSAGFTLAAAIAVAVLAGGLNSALFSYLRRSDSGASIDDSQLAGSTGTVVLPISPGSRGRVVVTIAGQRRYLSATAHAVGGAPADGTAVEGTAAAPPRTLEAGAPILVVEVRDAVALVVPLDPELT